jgi:hypothetical protein
MANAARVHAVENGEDLGEYTMIAFGGAAPLHAGRLCEKLGISRCLVPSGAGVGSAIGFLRAPFSFEANRSVFMRLSNFDPAAIKALLGELEDEATRFVRSCDGNAQIQSRVQGLHALCRSGLGNSRRTYPRAGPRPRSMQPSSGLPSRKTIPACSAASSVGWHGNRDHELVSQCTTPAQFHQSPVNPLRKLETSAQATGSRALFDPALSATVRRDRSCTASRMTTRHGIDGPGRHHRGRDHHYRHRPAAWPSPRKTAAST